MLQKQAEADGLRALMDVNPNGAVLELKRYEALMKAADGQASKIIIPTDVAAGVAKNVVWNETTGIGNTTAPAPKAPAAPEVDPCCDRFKDDEE